MARIAKVQACIFCDKAPCECNGSSKKAARQPVRTKTKVETVDLLSDEKPVWSQPEPVSRFKTQRDRPTTENELILRTALQNLAAAGLLHEDDLALHHHLINPPLKVSTERQLAEWRERNGK